MIAVLFPIVFGAWAGLATGSGPAPGGKGTEVLRGTVLKVLGDRLVIDADDPDRKMEVDVARDATVTVGGETADLKAVRPGMRVSITRDRDGLARRVAVERGRDAEADTGRTRVGTIRRAVPAVGGTRLMVESDGGEVYSYLVPTDAKVMVGGESATAADLSPGMPATIGLDKTGGVRRVEVSKGDGRAAAPAGEVPGRQPGRSSKRYEVAAGHSVPFAGTFGGTFAHGPVLAYDFGQQSADNAYVRPLYTAGRQPWTLNVLPRKKAFHRAGQQPGRPDPYVEAFLRNDGTGDQYPNAPNEVPGYPAWYWTNPSSRPLPLFNRYLYDFRFGLGEQEGASGPAR